MSCMKDYRKGCRMGCSRMGCSKDGACAFQSYRKEVASASACSRVSGGSHIAQGTK